MSLTKKDFEQLADVIGRVFYMTNAESIDRELITSQMVNFCKEQNERFASALFIDRIKQCEARMRALSERAPMLTGEDINIDSYSARKQADHIDGYDRDDLGESPDY